MARALVAYENPQSSKRFESYRAAVTAAVRKMGRLTPEEGKDVVQKDEPYVAASFRAELDPKTAAGVIYHKHMGDRVVAGSPASGAACPPPEAIPAAAAAASTCGPFTKVVRDEAKYGACRTRALDLGSLTNPKAIYALVGPELAHETQEVFVAIGFDVNMTLLCYDEIARGQVDHVAVAPSDVLGVILLNRCKSFLVAHNHPSGDARPSKDDGVLTTKIKDACAPFAGLIFRDHLVIGHGEVYSFTEKKLTKGLR